MSELAAYNWTPTGSLRRVPAWVGVVSAIPVLGPVVTVLRKYRDFSGRAGRREFWTFLAVTTLVGAALGSLNFTMGDSLMLVGVMLAGAWTVVMAVPLLAVTRRRLRDAGRSWSALLWLLLPIGGVVVLAVYLSDPGRG